MSGNQPGRVTVDAGVLEATAATHARYRRAWHWPACPDCASNVLVDRQRGAGPEYICHGCGRRFDRGRLVSAGGESP